jgi:flavin reductase (DIM6/NTAB) family NADH-FMN oxidoreductase RutF
MASPVNSARLNDILSQLSCQLLTIHPASQANMFLGRVLLQRLPAPALLDVRSVSRPVRSSLAIYRYRRRYPASWRRELVTSSSPRLVGMATSWTGMAPRSIDSGV